MFKTVTIKNWDTEDRPREKLLQKGRSALTNAELIAILLGTGTPNETALDLAKKILKTTGNDLTKLANMSSQELMKFKGIGQAKAITLITALELGRRKESSEIKFHKISSSRDAYKMFYSDLADLEVEEFWALYLNQANKVIRKERISRGGITATLADIRIIMKKALEVSATGLVVAHNHPSGSPKPSTADKSLTKQIVEACSYFNIRMIDHLIIFDKRYFSFADEGIL